MGTTPNYNFTVPVGSDIVNHLVQDFPNWTSLDTILKGISETGISTATHTKAGTVHAIILTDSDIPFFRFQATAAFATNDTFTVDGVAVSGVTMDGAGLPNEAFVIGSTVLCELNNNVLTFYGVTDSDADTLEGHTASYFATASDLQTVDDKADANKILIDNLENQVVYTTTLSVADQLVFDTNIQCGISSHDLSTAPGYPTGVTIIAAEVVSSNISTYTSDLVEAQVLSDNKTLKLCHRGSINSTGVVNTTVRFYYKA